MGGFTWTFAGPFQREKERERLQSFAMLDLEEAPTKSP